MAIREWHLGGAFPVTIRLEHRYWSGRASISVNGEERYRRGFRLVDFGLTYRFDAGNGDAEVRVTVGPLASYRYELFVGGEPQKPVSVPPVTPWARACLLAVGVSWLLCILLGFVSDWPAVLRTALAGLWMATAFASILCGLVAVIRLDQRRETETALVVGFVALLGGWPVLGLVPLLFEASGLGWPD